MKEIPKNAFRVVRRGARTREKNKLKNFNVQFLIAIYGRICERFPTMQPASQPDEQWNWKWSERENRTKPRENIAGLYGDKLVCSRR